MFWTKPRYTDDQVTTDQFKLDVRKKISEGTCKTSGICVYEHDSEGDLDDQERTILENLRLAHENWIANNP